ncbi:MAG: MFS transporter [Gemmatimonadetes bacterium]|nr:MFS transporter [Gemmatimonadota bacterium]
MPGLRSRFGVVFLTVFIDLAGFGLILPILPYYTQRFAASALGFGALIGVYSLMQFLATQILGRLSDRHGRRPILLISILFSGVGYCLFALAGTYGLLFLARMVSGFSGGNISVAQAYVADVTTPAERSQGMGMIGAAFGLGFVVGPALGGLAGHYGGATAPVWVAAGLCAINLVSAYYLLPESLRVEHRTERPLLDLAHLRRAVAHPRMRPLMAFWFIVPISFSGYTVATPLYAAKAFGWRERDLGWLFTIVGITAASVQGYFFGRLSRRVGDRTLLIAGAFGMIVGIGVVPFAPSAAALYGWTFVLAFANSIAAPAASGLVSRFADVTEQGSTLGAAQALSALGRLLGPVAVGEVYDTLGARAAFLVSAGLMLLAAIAALRVPAGETAPDPIPSARG